MKHHVAVLVVVSALLVTVYGSPSLHKFIVPRTDDLGPLVNEGVSIIGVFRNDVVACAGVVAQERVRDFNGVVVDSNRSLLVIATPTKEVADKFRANVITTTKRSWVLSFGSDEEMLVAQYIALENDLDPTVIEPSDTPVISPALAKKFNTKLNHNDQIQKLVDSVSRDSQHDFLAQLTAIHTRLATTDEAKQAQYFLAGALTGYNIQHSFFPFANGQYADNVIAEFPGQLEPDTYVIIGAHYDDRQNNILNKTARAPGANDDGSGTAALMEIARIFSAHKVQFRYTLRLVWFCAEEQGLIGSKAYANSMKDNNVDVMAMVQGDMIAYLAPGNPVQIDMAILQTSSNLTKFLNEVTQIYVPNLLIGTTTSCCSDQQSFHQLGYPAAAYNEKGGYTIDPEYHRSNDNITRPGYDFHQLQAATQAILAGAAVLAEVL